MQHLLNCGQLPLKCIHFFRGCLPAFLFFLQTEIQSLLLFTERLYSLLQCQDSFAHIFFCISQLAETSGKFHHPVAFRKIFPIKNGSLRRKICDPCGNSLFFPPYFRNLTLCIVDLILQRLACLSDRRDTPDDDSGLRLRVFSAQLKIFFRAFRFRLQRTDPRLQIGDDVVYPIQIAVSGQQLFFRFRLFASVLYNARSLFENFPAAVRPTADDFRDFSLSDKRISVHTDTGIHDQFPNVPQTALGAVDIVLAFTGTIHSPGDLHFGKIHWKTGVTVVDQQRDFRHPPGFSRSRSGKDHFVHFSAAQRLRTLFAQYPADRITDVAFTTAVWTYYTGDPAAEIYGNRLRKGFEPMHFDFLKVHAFPFPSFLPLPAAQPVFYSFLCLW